MESPSFGLRRNLLADAAAHSVAVFEETLQRHIAQAAHGGISHIGAQGAARIGVSEKIVFRIAHAHFIPDSDAHRRAFLGIYGLASQILLIETQIHAADRSEETDEQRVRAELEGKKMEPWLVNHADHAPEKQEDLRLAFLDGGEQAEEFAERGEDRNENHARDERDEEGQQEAHCPMSRMMRRARLYRSSRTLRR